MVTLEPREKVLFMKHPMAKQHQSLISRQLSLLGELAELENEEKILFGKVVTEAISCTSIALNACVLNVTSATVADLKIETQCLLDFVTERKYGWPKQDTKALGELSEKFHRSATLISAKIPRKSKKVFEHVTESFARIKHLLEW